MRGCFHLVAAATGGVLFLLLGASAAWAQRPEPQALAVTEARIVTLLPPTNHGVTVLRSGAAVADPAYLDQVLHEGDVLETGPSGSALLSFSERETLTVQPGSAIRIGIESKLRRGFKLLRGLLRFFHRDEPEGFEADTPTMGALILGTEFELAVADNGATTLRLFDGRVDLRNTFGQLTVTNGDEAVVEPGRPPVRTAVVTATNLVQWNLYYPGVLSLDDLRLSDEERRVLGGSLAAYAAGDLLGALAAYPPGREPASDDERLYRAALLLSSGRVNEVEAVLRNMKMSAAGAEDFRRTSLAGALRAVIAAVHRRPARMRPLAEAEAPLATALLAASYEGQSQLRLDEARTAARRATEVAPGFSFAWSRLAELEFSFGRSAAAERAVTRSLALAPRNAEALALRGFLLAARNRFGEAIASFEQAIALDGALGNAWLGRGLCRIHQGRGEAGRNDLQVAVTVEPQRAVLRSYLGKAFSEVGDERRALRELALAQAIDPGDPTAWLYRALLNQQDHRINDAVRDLEHSQELNTNRSVYRSSLLLEQDAAVRGANLATIYRDAGLTDVSLREAARAVSRDYANYSAHLFLANSFNELRDPRQFNLRYETPALSEYLVANLLAPVGAGTLSPFVTQQEYSRLFDRNRFGLSSATEYWSQGDWQQTAVQHGVWDNSSYALEGLYRSENGHRPNNDVEQISGTLKWKQQLTPQDSLFLQGTWYRGEGGDVRPVPNEAPTNLNLSLRTREVQEPLVLAGLHHQWSPEAHTLFLGGLVRDTFRLHTTNQYTLLLAHRADGSVQAVVPGGVEQRYQTEALLYTAELQHLQHAGPQTFVVGGRYQTGDFDTRNSNRVTSVSFVNDFGADARGVAGDVSFWQQVRPGFERWNVYAYDHWQPWEALTLIGGVAYDHLRFPTDFRYAPVAAGEESVDQVSPKAGAVWTPHPTTTARFAFSRSLGGVAFDQSFQLEPAQVAGFLQSYRSLIPEAVAGANAAPRNETFGLALDQKFPTGTYVGLSGEWLEAAVRREFGVVDKQLPVAGSPVLVPAQTRERLDFVERSVALSVHQLLGREWAMGARYRVSVADLEDAYPDIPQLAPGFLLHNFRVKQNLSATLHQVNLYLLYTHASGFFGQVEGIWAGQANHGYVPALVDDDFGQLNVYAGWRSARRRVEVRLGVLNATDQAYHLNPLNLTTELPHERTFYASLRFSF